MRVSVFYVQLFLLLTISLVSVSSSRRFFERIREYFRNLRTTTSSPYLIRSSSTRLTNPSTTPSWSIADKKMQFTTSPSPTSQILETTSQSPSSSERSSPTTGSLRTTPTVDFSDLDCWWSSCNGNCPGPALVKGSRPCESEKLQFNCCIGRK